MARFHGIFTEVSLSSNKGGNLEIASVLGTQSAVTRFIVSYIPSSGDAEEESSVWERLTVPEIKFYGKQGFSSGGRMREGKIHGEEMQSFVGNS